MAINQLSGKMLEALLERGTVDISVETDTLYVDVTSDRVGINNATPGHSLDVVGTGQIADLIITTNTISAETAGIALTTTANGDLTITTGSGVVDLLSSAAVQLPSGTTLEQPTGVAGMLRWNEDNTLIEYYDGAIWNSVAPTTFTVIDSEEFAGTGAQTIYTLAAAQTTASCIVSINGVVQVPATAYGVSGTTLTFTEAPALDDVIEVRTLTTTSTVNAISDGTATFTASTTQFDITGDIIPTQNEIYDLGSASFRWKELHLAGTTIFLGGALIKFNGTAFEFFESDGTTPAEVSAINIDGGTY